MAEVTLYLGYFAIAEKRIQQAQMQLLLPLERTNG